MKNIFQFYKALAKAARFDDLTNGWFTFNITSDERQSFNKLSEIKTIKINLGSNEMEVITR